MKIKQSGGVAPRNPREGFRSEYIAEYVFSAFGTAVLMTQGNDVGIDLICNLTSFEGKLIYFESSYGVQVKSIGAPFKFEGKQATEWLRKIEYPLLLAEVNKKEAHIKIYSTWNLNRFLLSLHTDEVENFPDQISFQTANVMNSLLEEPCPQTGVIPVGKPILEFSIIDLGDDKKLDTYRTILKEWLEMDARNYKARRSGISRIGGFTTWDTNKSLIENERKTYNPSYFSHFHEQKNKEVIANAIMSLGYYRKKWFEDQKDDKSKAEFNALRNFAIEVLSNQLDDEAQKLFENEL